MLNGVEKTKCDCEMAQAVVTAETLALVEEQVQDHVEAQARNEKGPWTLWSELQSTTITNTTTTVFYVCDCHSTESERLADVLAKYGNNPEGIPALHYAILQQDLAAIDLLLKHGASPHAVDNAKSNCLYYAIKVGSLLLVKKFVQLNVNTGLVSYNGGVNALFVSVRMNQPEIANFLVESSSVSKENMNLTLRDLASGGGDFTFEQRKKTISLLVKHGGDINTGDYIGDTPLDYAITFSKDTKMIEFLQSLGAKRRLKDNP
jgi:hypothetical protein